MPPEIGLLALCFAVPALILSIRTRRELFGGRRGRPPLFGAASDREADLERALERMEAQNRELTRRLAHLEAIATSEPTPRLAIPEADPAPETDAERVARAARLLDR